MNFPAAVSTCFTKYVSFGGRARRSEYWYFTLFLVIASICLSILDVALFLLGWSFSIALSTVFSIATFLPSLAVSARRLHDIGRSAWWLLLILTVIGIIWLIIWACQKSEDEENRFGPNPMIDRKVTTPVNKLVIIVPFVIIALLIAELSAERLFSSEKTKSLEATKMVSQFATTNSRSAETPLPNHPAILFDPSDIVQSESGITLLRTNQSNKWRMIFEEPIFGNWYMGRPMMRPMSEGTTEFVVYGPPQQATMYFEAAGAIDTYFRLRSAYLSETRGTRRYERAYQAYHEYEKSDYRFSEIFDVDENSYVDYRWAAYRFEADELLRRHSPNVVRDWLCQYRGNSVVDVTDGDLINCYAPVYEESCQAPQIPGWSEGEWQQADCLRWEYMGLHEFAIFQSSHTRHNNLSSWSDGRLFKGDFVRFTGVMKCLDVDYNDCHVRATDIEVLPSE